MSQIRLPESITSHLRERGRELVERAFYYALEKHRNQKKSFGEPFINHPLGVAEILASLRMDSHTIAAALLHDTVRDAESDLREIEKLFGDDVVFLVRGVAKIREYSAATERHKAESFRKLLVAISKDLRVLLIELADRLHSLRTLKNLPEEIRRKIAQETLDVYAPIAHRLGIWRIKWELEDLAFKYLHPELYRQILKKVRETREMRESYVKMVINELSELLSKNGIKADVEGRPKHIYSIYRKILRKGVTIDEIYDLYGFRVITLSISDCYTALGVIHSKFKPVPGRFKDYIAMPKPNLYQSLHTTVVGPENKFLEIQIRTRKMHEIAEEGIAAHWRYKEDYKPSEKEVEQFQWLRNLLELYRQSPSPEEFMQKMREEFVGEEIYVFTPKGDIVTLPIGSTPVDFAYHIHTELGHRVKAAKVNGRLVSLSTVLESGDIVEIIAKKTPKPRRSWLEFVKTSKARNRIRQWFRRVERERDIERGHNLLLKEARKRKRTLKEEDIRKAVEHFNLKDKESLYLEIVRGGLRPEAVIGFLFGAKPREKEKREKSLSYPIVVEGMEDLEVSIAKCCNPLPGDEIAGIITSQRRISIHRVTCPHLRKYKSPEKILKAWWKEGSEGIFPVRLRITAVDRDGFEESLSRIVERMGTTMEIIRSFEYRGSKRVFDVRIPVRNREQLRKLLTGIVAMPDVVEIKRFM